MVDLEAVCKVCDWRIERQRITVVSLQRRFATRTFRCKVVSLQSRFATKSFRYKDVSLQSRFATKSFQYIMESFRGIIKSIRWNQLFVLNCLKQFRIE